MRGRPSFWSAPECLLPLAQTRLLKGGNLGTSSQALESSQHSTSALWEVRGEKLRLQRVIILSLISVWQFFYCLTILLLSNLFLKYSPTRVPNSTLIDPLCPFHFCLCCFIKLIKWFLYKLDPWSQSFPSPPPKYPRRTVLTTGLSQFRWSWVAVISILSLGTCFVVFPLKLVFSLTSSFPIADEPHYEFINTVVPWEHMPMILCCHSPWGLCRSLWSKHCQVGYHLVPGTPCSSVGSLWALFMCRTLFILHTCGFGPSLRAWQFLFLLFATLGIIQRKNKQGGKKRNQILLHMKKFFSLSSVSYFIF